MHHMSHLLPVAFVFFVNCKDTRYYGYRVPVKATTLHTYIIRSKEQSHSKRVLLSSTQPHLIIKPLVTKDVLDWVCEQCRGGSETPIVAAL